MPASVFTGTGGNVTGPVSATNAVPVLFDGTTGQLIQNSTPTGTGNPVLQGTPTLTTPVLGAATGTSIALTGTLQVGTLGAFVTADKYVIVDSSGHFHVSGLGPAS